MATTHDSGPAAGPLPAAPHPSQGLLPTEVRVHASMRELPSAAWDSLFSPDQCPTLAWDFLDTLEQSGCVRSEAGWVPQHVSFWAGERLIGAAPTYLKGNSDGEFVFDHSWADFCQRRLRRPYYPKLISAVPFTPVSGPRLLLDPECESAAMHAALSRVLIALVERQGLSGAHVLFPPPETAGVLEQTGFARRHGVQFHFRNPGYGSFEEFLQRFTSKRRHQIKRERLKLAEQGLELSVKQGDELGPSGVDHIFDFYLSTVDKYFYGRRYLNRAFFEEVCARMPKRVVVVFAHERGSRTPVAGAFNLLGQNALYGRYWGTRAEVPFLHFNVCYYAGIDLCIERGLALFEPGAGGEHKHVRGFESTLTHSVHYLREHELREPVLDFLRRERVAIEADLASEEPRLKPLSLLDETPPPSDPGAGSPAS